MVYTTCLKSPEAMNNVKLICFGSRINYLNQPISANARSAFASFSFSDRLTRSIAGMFPHLRRILRIATVATEESDAQGKTCRQISFHIFLEFFL